MMRPAWLHVAPLVAVVANAQAPAAMPEPPAAVVCETTGDADGRAYRLERVVTGEPAPIVSAVGRARWQLRGRSRATNGQWITLALPGAEPTFTRDTANLSYRNANGGRHVELKAGPMGSTLEVWVDHGLEVNIEPDLDPRVDLLSTEGPATADCVLGPAASAAVK
jgi:hypothetical protein